MMEITKDGWRLIKANGTPVLEGETLNSFRGKPMVVKGGVPPHKPSSTGRIWVEGGTCGTLEYFPTVFNCVWVKGGWVK